VITLYNVSKFYTKNQLALNNISLQIEAGEMVFLKGHSGAGKSTLLKLIARLESPSSGHIIVSGRNIQYLTTKQLPYYRRLFGFICQNPQLLNNFTVAENVALPLQIASYHKKEILRRVHAALERVGLQHKANLIPLMLSEGERQRVGIARAVVHKPRFLLADEPTGNLDPALSLEIMKLFERFNQVGVTVLIASHDHALLKQFKHRVLELSEGKLLNCPAKHSEKKSKDAQIRERVDE